jgi:hypothetical protein
MTTIENKSILVAVSEYGEFSSLLPLAKEFEERFGLHPVFVFTYGYGLAHEHGRLVEIEGWSWTKLGTKEGSFYTLLDVNSKKGYFVSRQDFFNRNSDINANHNGAVSAISRGLFASMFLILAAKKKMLRRLPKFGGKSYGDTFPKTGSMHLLKHTEYIFQKVKPRLIISGQDYALSVTSFLSKVGEKYGVSTLIIPYSMPPTTKEIIETFSQLKYNRLNQIEKWLAQRNIPHWLNSYRGQVYSRVSPLQAMDADRHGLTPPEPWVPNSGRGVVCVPSKWALEYYSKAGIPADQLRLTGAPWSDALVRSVITRSTRKKQLMESIETFSPSRFKNYCETDKLVILSWAPNQYPRKSYNFSTYEALCNAFIELIWELEINCIGRIAVSIHPTVTDETLLKKFHDARIFTLRSNLIDHIDCADVFISTVSSTNFWALQCGIPTINFDGYLYGYTEFDEAGAITVKLPYEIFAVCKRLLKDEAYYSEVKARIENRSSLFCETGGENLESIMSLAANFFPAGD